jgi:putative phosphoesterase
MRILLLADLHANWPALQAIQEPHDVCLCLGDLVDYGVQPAPCIHWVREHATHVVRGNHDHGVAQHVRVAGRTGFRYLTAATRGLTQQLISSEDRRYLSTMPVSRMVTLDDVRFFLVHATPRDPLDEFALPDLDLWTRRLQNVEADVVCVGHTHLPYVLEVGDKLVINPGSVGQPRDGDPRAAYAIIDDNRVELKRAAYAIDEAVRSIDESGLPEQVRTLLAQVLRYGGLPRQENNNNQPRPVEPAAAKGDAP